MKTHPLYLYRQEHGLTLEELGVILGVKRDYLSKVERGKNKVTVPRALQWESLIGVSWQQLVLYNVTPLGKPKGTGFRPRREPNNQSKNDNGND